MNFATLKGLTIPEGVVTQITDESGRVLWSSTIKFTINGDTYIADRGMTWAERFASDYNTTGETEGDIKDANGNEVSMDAVIIGGTAYEVGFAPSVATITLKFTVTYGSYGVAQVWHNDKTYYYGPPGFDTIILTANVGDVISIDAYGYVDNALTLNGKAVASAEEELWYDYTVVSDAVIELYSYGEGYGSRTEVSITEK